MLIISTVFILVFGIIIYITHGNKSKEIYKLNMYNDILELCQEARKNPNKKRRKN